MLRSLPSFSRSAAAWLSITMNSEFDSIVEASTESSRYSTFCVMAVGNALRLRKRRHALLKNAPEYSFSNTTWNSSMTMCVRLPARQLSVTRLIMASVMTSSPMVFSCRPSSMMSYTSRRLLVSTLVGWANASSVPEVNSSSDSASSRASSSGCASSLSRRWTSVGGSPPHR